MALAATYFYADVAQFVTVAIQIVFVIIEIVALVNCITQRADAFPVVGSLSKNVWMAILAGSVLVTLVCGVFTSSLLISFFAFIAITATGVYMLDVRPALREATDGSGNW